MTHMEKITVFIDWLDVLLGNWSSKRRAKSYKNGYDWAFGRLLDNDDAGEMSGIFWYGEGPFVQGGRQALMDWDAIAAAKS